MSTVAGVIAFFIELGKLAFVGIVAYYVCVFLPMPDNAKKICQMIVVAICVLAALAIAAASSSVPRSQNDRSMSMDRVPSIMTPERK